MSRRFLRLTLKTKILALVLVGVSVPVLLLGSYLLRRNGDILASNVRETLSNDAGRTASRLDEWLQERVQEVSRWSTSFVVFEGAEELALASSERARHDVEGYLQSVLGHYPVYESLFLVDGRGGILASTRPETLEDAGKRLLETARARGAAVSPLFRSEVLARETLLIVHPVESRAERTVAYLVERVDLAEVRRLLAPASAGQTPSFWLLDEEGRAALRAEEPLEARGGAFPGLRTAREVGAAAGEGDVPGLGRAVYSLQPLHRMPGFVAATVPREIAYAPISEARRRLLGLGLAALALLLIATYLVSRGLLQPIFRLSEAARRLSEGDLEVSLPARGRDEVSDLTRAFNRMASTLKEGRQALEALATTDGLTGLFNRRYFQESLDREVRRSEREGRATSLLMLDLDDFARYNVQWGRNAGDVELRRVAVEILQTIRSTDLAFRYGGEELAVLLHTCGKEQALRVAEKLRVAMEAGRLTGVSPGSVAPTGTTVSIGVATFPDDGRVATALVAAAEAALGLAKADGRNCVVAARVGSPRPTTGVERLVHLRSAAVAELGRGPANETLPPLVELSAPRPAAAP